MAGLESPVTAQGVSQKRQSAPSGARGPPLQLLAAGAAVSVARSTEPHQLTLCDLKSKTAIVRARQARLEPGKQIVGTPQLLFKCDAIIPARALFDAGLDDDSRSASTHLHLGESFGALSNMQSGDSEDQRRADQWKRASEFCFSMAVALAGDRDSHTKRRARTFLDNRHQRNPPTPSCGAAA